MKNRVFAGIIVFALITLTTTGLITSVFITKGYVSSVEPFFTSLLEGRFEDARQSLFILSNADPLLFSDEKLTALQVALKASLNDLVAVRFNRSQKTFSTNQSEATPDGTTRVFFDLVSRDQYIEVETLIDDKSQKIQYLNFPGAARQVPNVAILWLVAAMFLTIPALNIWAMVVIRTHLQKGRMWRYVTVLLFNIPTITYFATGNINLNLLANQMVLGWSLDLSGLSRASVSIGLPLGAIFWILKLRSVSRQGREKVSIAEGGQETEVLWECPKCHEKNPKSTFACLKCEYRLK